MKFILFSDVGNQSIRDSLGRPDYSYHFLRKAFEPVLARIGTIAVVEGLLDAVDAVYEQAVAAGETCVLVWFGPPNKAPLHLKCPVLPVFAWEFTNIPNEVWDDPRNDWRHVFGVTGRAISQSGFGAKIVKAAMGPDYPVVSLPAPTWDRFAELRKRLRPEPVISAAELLVRGDVMDSRCMDLSPENELPAVLRTETMLAERRSAAAALQAEPIDLVPFAPLAEIPASQPAETEADHVTPRTIGDRLRATARHIVGWYRDAVRDLLPFWLVWAVSHLVRGGIAALRPRRPVQQPERPSFAMRIDATRHHFHEWYDEVLSDVVPIWLATPSSRAFGLFYRVTLGALLPKTLPPPPPPILETRLSVSGVVYTSVLNPADGRKNLDDIVTAFCWAFRDRPDATLILKFVHNDRASYWRRLERLLNLLSPFRCRVIAFHGFMETREFENLIAMTSYCVNASHGEGLCLPLLEYMSCGKPAVAPDHTAMEDYINDKTAFVVRSSKELNVWPQDKRDQYRTMRYRINWESLRDAYVESYRVAMEQPDRYAAMSAASIETQRKHSELSVIEEGLKAFLASVEKAETANFAGEVNAGFVPQAPFPAASSN